MIPRSGLFVLLGFLALLAAAAIWLPALGAVWRLGLVCIAVLAILDTVLAYRSPLPEVSRKMPSSMSLATWVQVRLTLTNREARRRLIVAVHDHYPQSFAARDMPNTVSLPRGRFVDIAYELRPTERGPFEFPGIELKIASPLLLWWRRVRVPQSATVRVYPNYSTIKKLLAYEVDNHLQLAGVRMSRRRGEGIEFHQLRDYRESDSLRAIDWKATSRMSRLIAREYQDERDQQIVFVLDAGRRMLARDAELSHFDHALNAMLLMSYVALRQGDAAGVMTVGETRRWRKPHKGMDAVNGLLNHVYDVQPEAIEIDYVAAATELAVRQRRRSLVVFLTNIREEDTEDLRVATNLLGRRHLVMLASLRERKLDEQLAEPVAGLDDALAFAATSQYLEQRREAQNLLRAKGVFVEDCLSEDLPAAITSRYLAIKRAGML
ncbi:MAG: DUF58 domain-containing protein [Pseudomonadota bacterium]